MRNLLFSLWAKKLNEKNCTEFLILDFYFRQFSINYSSAASFVSSLSTFSESSYLILVIVENICS